MTDINLFTPGGNTTELDVTAVSANVQLTGVDGYSGSVVQLYNAGPGAVYYTLGSSSAAAAVIPTSGSPAAGVPLQAGGTTMISVTAAKNWLAAICGATGTASLYATVGQGS